MRTHTRTLLRAVLIVLIAFVLFPGVARAQDHSLSMSFLPAADSPAAQSSGSGGVGVGIKGGFLYNSLTFSDASQVYDGRAGWTVGLFFGGHRSGTFGVMGELNFQKKGASDALSGAVTDLYYLDLPVLLRINIGSHSTGGVSVYLITGPGFDFKIGDSVSQLASFQTYETFNVTWVAGAGIEITRFIIEGRGIWGLQNIAVTQLSNQTLKSRSFALQIGVRFN
ncbi:MAG: outer membrane beta-barrel protein [Vicinamibacterales bacterium]